MAKLFASWVPGYAFVAQGDTSGYREGFGVTFHLEAGQGDWFHAPIPTPVIVENERARLGQVIVLYSFPQTAALHSVHVWDGPNRISATDGLDLTGDHGAGMDGDNTFPVIHEGILLGVGISLLVSTTDVADIHFAGAGVDFYHDI